MRPFFKVSIRSKSGEVAATKPPKLLDPIGNRVRGLGYSRRTEITYVGWIKRFILFHGKWHLSEMGEAEVEAFLILFGFREECRGGDATSSP